MQVEVVRCRPYNRHATVSLTAAHALDRHSTLAWPRLRPIYIGLLITGIGLAGRGVDAQTISLTSGSPRYVLTGNQTVSAVTVGNNVSGVISGPGYTLTYVGATTGFILGGTSATSRMQLDMTGLTNFVFNNPTQTFIVSGRSNTGAGSGTLFLAQGSNAITTSSFSVGSVANGAGGAFLNLGTVRLGKSNSINANTINIGTASRTGGTLSFQNGIGDATLVLRGVDGASPVANWNIGINGTGNANTSGTVDLSGGTLDAKVTNLTIGEARSGSFSGVGTLTLDKGTLDATSIVLGLRDGTAGTGSASGTMTVNNATVTAQTLTLGSDARAAGTATATLNLNGGALLAQTIQPGTGGGIRNFNWNGGTLGNYAEGSNMTVSIPTITLAGSGNRIFDVEGGGATATVNSVLSGAGGFTKTGAGILALTGTNAYAGGTTVTGGLINFATLDNLGAGNVTLDGGGLQWATGSTVDVSPRLNPLGAGGGTLDTQLNDVTLASPLTGAGQLIKNGQGTLTLTASNTYAGGTTINAGQLQLGDGGTSGGIVGNVVDNASLQFNRSDAVTFDGTISGGGTLSIAGSGVTVLTGDNTFTGGTTIEEGSGGLQLGNGGSSGSVIGTILDNSSLSIDRADTLTLSSTILGSGSLAQTGTGTTILTSDNTYTGDTIINAGMLQLGNGGTTGSVIGNITDNGTLAFNRSDDLTYSNIISGTGGVDQLGPGTLRFGGDQTYAGPTRVLAGTLAIDGSIQSSTVTVAPGATLSGFGVIGGDVQNQGRVWPGNPIVGDTHYGSLTIRGNYVGQGGVLELNTYMGGDDSPSDRLIIDGGAATGSTTVVAHNTAATIGETTGNGVLVVSAIHGATTTTDAFRLAGELRSGALDYRLFRGGVDGSDVDSWYLRNEFVVPPEPPGPPEEELPIDPPVDPVLPPGVYPIIGPQIATYSSVMPVARDLAQFELGTLDQRIGDSALMASEHADSDHGPSVWARVFANSFNHTYRSFAAPRADGDIYGIQVGADLWQGEWISGHADRMGAYLAYGRAGADVRGLVTNDEATGYEMQPTGTLRLYATSFGAYFTHYGPGDWYVDGVVQATSFRGHANTSNTSLDTGGTGLLGSLEAGYPFPWAALGPGFVLEPQIQLIWQKSRFGSGDDGLGEVALGSAYGNTGRVGLRGKWSWTTAGGQLWQPYVAVNWWRDWGARATTVYDDLGSVPAVVQASRAELSAGVTARLTARLTAYASGGGQVAVGRTTNARRDSLFANAGLRWTW